MILNRDGQDWLPPLYDSLRRQDYPSLVIYMVDNGSTDDSIHITQVNFPDVRILRYSANLGYSIAYNQAMPVAFADGCEWVIWSNSDILLLPGCLRELAKIAQSQQGVGVIGPAFYEWGADVPNYYMTGKHPLAAKAMTRYGESFTEVDWVEGSFLMVSARCVQDVGGLDPLLFFYWEEADFCRRVRYKGWRVLLSLRALARHYGGGSSLASQNAFSAMNYRKSRNQYIYTLTNPDRAFTANVFRATHLFLVLLKSAIRTSWAHVGFELRVLWNIVREFPEIWQKWRRDRVGGHPPLTTAEYRDVCMERVLSANTPSLDNV